VLLIARYHVPAPSRLIARGLGGPGLLVYVLVSKLFDHLPLYRQSEIYAREGVDLERSTLADWVGQSSQLLRPLISTLEHHVMSGYKIHADYSPIGVLTPGHDKTKTARLWTYAFDDRPAGYSTPAAVWFAYSPDRKKQQARRVICCFHGAPTAILKRPCPSYGLKRAGQPNDAWDAIMRRVGRAAQVSGAEQGLKINCGIAAPHNPSL